MGAWPVLIRAKVIIAAEQANAMGFINEMSEGLDSMIGENGIKLSGGQCQRLAIARSAIEGCAAINTR